MLRGLPPLHCCQALHSISPPTCIFAPRSSFLAVERQCLGAGHVFPRAFYSHASVASLHLMPPGWRPLHDYACLFTVFQSSHACTSGAWEPPLQAFLCSSPPNVLLPQTCVLSSTSCSLHSSRTSRFFSMQVVVLPLPLLGALHDLRFSTCLHPVSLLLLRLFPPCALTRSSLPTPLPHLSLPAPSLTFKPGRASSGQPYCATLHTSPERALTFFSLPTCERICGPHPAPRAEGT